MTLSTDSKKLINDRLRTAKNEKKKLTAQIQNLNVQKDSLTVQKDALTEKINHLEADLAL